MQNPPNPMPKTKPKLLELIKRLHRAEPSKDAKAALALSEYLLKFLENSLLIYIPRDSIQGQLLAYLDGSPHYKGPGNCFVVNNAGYAPLVNALIKKFGGNF